jgi:predicted pyridoxine 5'-phosphate oxidase superfamily flavin-nucleotide-binding protein
MWKYILEGGKMFMPKLTEEVKSVFSKQEVFPVATASQGGVPNVVPMSFVKVYDDDHILIVDNFMDKTKKNLLSNPWLSLYVWDGKQSYQIKGKATIHASGQLFEEAVAWVKDKMPVLQPRSAVLVEVTNIFVCQPGENLGKEL